MYIYETILQSGDTWQANIYACGYVEAVGANVTLTANMDSPAPAELIFKQDDSVGGWTLTINGQTVTVDPAPGAVTWVSLMKINGVLCIRGKATNTSSGTTPTQLAAPVISITSGTATPVVLSWSPVTNATRYTVQRAADSAFTQNLQTLSATTTSSTYTDATAAAGTTYFYRVFADADGYTQSPWSNTVQAAVAASPGGVVPLVPTGPNVGVSSYYGGTTYRATIADGTQVQGIDSAKKIPAAGYGRIYQDFDMTNNKGGDASFGLTTSITAVTKQATLISAELAATYWAIFVGGTLITPLFLPTGTITQWGFEVRDDGGTRKIFLQKKVGGTWQDVINPDTSAAVAVAASGDLYANWDFYASSNPQVGCTINPQGEGLV